MTCIHCDQPAARTLGTTGYCAEHLEQFLAPIRQRVTLNGPFSGRAIRAGINRPEHGPGAFDAECDRCAATWVALYEGEPCGWCATRHEHLMAHHAELVLTPPLIDEWHHRKPQYEAWARRMAAAVRAGIITEQQAHQAWTRGIAA